MAITYNAAGTRIDLTHLFRATSGGTVFSANLNTTAAFDLFDDTAVANDAIYFGVTNKNFSDLYFAVEILNPTDAR